MESLGKRIAKLRACLGWTQQELAERAAVSRVALSHIESDISVPGERTVALLAGVFGMEAHDLVAGTTYPMAKADRLPLVVARHTEAELQVALLDRDLALVVQVGDPSVLEGWTRRLSELRAITLDRRQLDLLDQALARAAAAAIARR